LVYSNNEKEKKEVSNQKNIIKLKSFHIGKEIKFLHIISYTEKVYTKRRLSRELLIGHKGREQYLAICV